VAGCEHGKETGIRYGEEEQTYYILYNNYIITQKKTYNRTHFVQKR